MKSDAAFQKPVEDSVPRIDNEVAVGEDLEFQRRWWKFERAMWGTFTLILALDLAGVFGRGPLAHAQLSNEALAIKYERVERSGTPSILQVSFKSPALAQGKVKLFVSESVVEELGAQRVIPAPAISAVGQGGVTYTFDAGPAPTSVEIALQPSNPGIYQFSLQSPGSDPLSARVFVMP